MEQGNRVSWPGWRTVREIGCGNFGMVYEIERKLFDDDEETEKAALKVISIPQNDSDIEEMYNDGYDEESVTSTFHSHLKNIVAEYTLMRKMNGSSNIVNCDDVRYVQHADGVGWDIFIKMELLTPLPKAVPVAVPEEQVVRIAKDMCAALELCNRYNIIHRDIKPQNIFVSENNNYKLGDFGIAKTVEKTMGGTKTGTYRYMAPEVYNNRPYNSTADIYSLGLVLYWLLNDRRMPFMPLPPEKLRVGMDEESRRRRFSGEPIPAPENGSEVLKQIVLKACAFDPKDRYQSAKEMLEALEALKQGRASVSNPITEEVLIEPVPSADAAKNKNDTVGIWSRVTEAPVVDDSQTVGPTWNHESAEDDDGGTVGPVFQEKESRQSQAETSTQSQDIKPETKKNSWWVIAIAILVAIALWAQPWSTNDGAQEERPAANVSVNYVSPTGGNTATNSQSIVSGDALKGDNTTANVPATREDSTAYGMIAAGNYHSAYLSPDGTVFAVGCSDLDTYNRGTRLDVSEWTDIIAISASNHTVGLRSDGTVVACGFNGYGKCDLSEWSGIVAISVSDGHTVGLRRDGTVVAKGNNEYGQCNVSQWQDIIAIAASKETTYGLRSNGTVISAGRNNYGDSWKNIVSICAGTYDLVGLRSDGTVVAAGSCNNWDNNTLDKWHDIVDISASSSHIVGLRADGTVVACGRERSYEACNVDDWSDIVQVSAGMYFTIGLKEDGTFVSVGLNAYNQCDLG